VRFGRLLVELLRRVRVRLEQPQIEFLAKMPKRSVTAGSGWPLGPSNELDDGHLRYAERGQVLDPGVKRRKVGTNLLLKLRLFRFQKAVAMVRIKG
jgi:hypothetical protein